MSSGPYSEILKTLRPLREMRHQWRGFLAVCGILLAAAIYIFTRLQGQVDVLDRELRSKIEFLELDMTRLRSDCEHVSPERMLQMDIVDAEQQRQINKLRKRR